MTGTLASDVQLLNGVSSEGVGVQIEGTVAVLTGMIGAFVLSWPLALCTIGLLPIFLICGAIEQKADQENMMNMEAQEGSEEMEQSDDVKESKLLCADSIANYKTVASFGNDELLIAKFGAINDRAAKAEEKSAKCYAISLSLATSINNGSFALLYLAMAQLFKEWPEYEYTQFD
jgi:ATP-binding cassette subfamily B (MDR/TAP) protein 1